MTDASFGENFDPLVPEDLRAIIGVVLDLVYYRQSPIGEDLARAAWVELTVAVRNLPEAKQ